MKRKKIISIVAKTSIITALLFTGCDTYLDRTPAADVTEDDVFRTYDDFQGFVDQMYVYLVDYNRIMPTVGGNFGDFWVGINPSSTAGQETQGRYRNMAGPSNKSLYITTKRPSGFVERPRGIYADGWRGIRAANLSLEKLPLLAGATEEEKQLIEGQAHFFRAYFHWEIIRAFGGLPYVDKVFQPDEDMNLPRLSYQETTDKIVEDFSRAAELLPEDWADTSVPGMVEGTTEGRVTKGAALAFKAKALLYAGSPLMNGESTGSYEYNNSYMEAAAEAAAEVIKLADGGVYNLLPMAEYNRNFARIDGTFPWTEEIIWGKMRTDYGRHNLFGRHGRIFSPARFGGNNVIGTPTQNLVDMFEMQSSGLPIEDPDSGYDPMDPWSDRDPRFRNGILIDGDEWTFTDPEENKLELFVGGRDKDRSSIITPYIIKKYWPKGANNYDNNANNYIYSTPHMRLAEVYLIYAEAVNEAYGPTGSAPGISMTAVEAINIVRARANMPTVHSKFTGSKDEFRKRIWNERGVELYFENNRWHDLRRWRVAHETKYKEIYDLQFDEDYTRFDKVKVATRIFEQRHYWLPFPIDQTQLYPQFPQNPGW